VKKPEPKKEQPKQPEPKVEAKPAAEPKNPPPQKQPERKVEKQADPEPAKSKKEPPQVLTSTLTPRKDDAPLSPKSEAKRAQEALAEKKLQNKAKRLSQQPISTKSSPTLMGGEGSTAGGLQPHSDLTLAERLVWDIVPEREIRLADAETVGKWYDQHTAYLVVDEKTGTEVRRRYNDFVWLRNTLARQVPKSFVPPIPSKQTFGRFEGAFIFRRQKGLQRLLNRLHEHPVLGIHPVFVSFMTMPDDKQFAEFQKDQEKVSKQIEKASKQGTPAADSLVSWVLPASAFAPLTHSNSFVPTPFEQEEKKFVTHDLSSLKTSHYVTALRAYVAKFRRSLELLNKNRSRLNEDQRVNSNYISDLGSSFQNVFLIESECPVTSATFAASLSRQNSDLQKLTQWNLEHITLRDESFSDSLSDYTGLVASFLKFVKAFEDDELRAFEKWREGYIGTRLGQIKKTVESQHRDEIKEKLADALSKDEAYVQATKAFFYNFDLFLTETEVSHCTDLPGEVAWSN